MLLVLFLNNSLVPDHSFSSTTVKGHEVPKLKACTATTGLPELSSFLCLALCHSLAATFQFFCTRKLNTFLLKFPSPAMPGASVPW